MGVGSSSFPLRTKKNVESSKGGRPLSFSDISDRQQKVMVIFGSNKKQLSLGSKTGLRK